MTVANRCADEFLGDSKYMYLLLLLRSHLRCHTVRRWLHRWFRRMDWRIWWTVTSS